MNRADEKRARLRAGLTGTTPIVAVGAHDAMSARLIEQRGFDAVWVSGLGVATMAHALPDINVVTMSEALEAAVRIDRATSLPVIADCDNGFGGFSNVLRTVVEYDRAGIAAVSIEDNLFPKRNSLYAVGDASRGLIPLEEQARRIRAAKAEQESEGFVLIARVESLIAGIGVEDACRRADAYVDAGLPWFDYYDADAEDLAPSEILTEVKAVGDVLGDGEEPFVPVDPKTVIPLGDPGMEKVSDGMW